MTTPLTSPPAEKIYTVRELAAYLKISKAQIYSMVSRNEIPHLKIGRVIRIRQKDLDQWMEERVRQAELFAV